jgi:glycosyltransferase involved in cell wall biosynthesis
MTICVNSMVKNEGNYLWFSIMSVVNFVDRIMIWDNGSCDDTFKIATHIRSLYPNKVEVLKIPIHSREEHSRVRNEMIKKTQEDWILLVDGDEVWWDGSILQITAKLKEGGELETIVNPFINLLGDIYHYQDESGFRNKIDDRNGCITVRAIRRDIPGLHVGGMFPKEGYLDENNIPVYERDKKKRVFINAPYLHFTHLQRSNMLGTEAIERRKIVEVGKPFPLDYYYPEVFFRSKPDYVNCPWKKIESGNLAASMFITPIKKLKREIVK